MRFGVLLIAAFAAVSIALPSLAARPARDAAVRASCTQAVKNARERALAAFMRQMAPARAAYFRRHKSPSARRAFVKRQQARLKALRALAACTVTQPTPPAPPPPPPPPPSPPTTVTPYSPALAKPAFADQRNIEQPWVGEWGPKSDPYWLPGRGTLRGLVIPVDFPDAVATRPVAFYRDLFRSIAVPYVNEVSYGRLNLELPFVDRWVRMSRPASSYGLQNCCPQPALRSFTDEVTSLVDAEIDFSAVDFVVAVGPESSGGSLNILLYRAWPGEGVTRDGKELRWGVIGAGNFRDLADAQLLPHHMITHELGRLLGLPDLYGRACATCQETSFAWAGAWDLMSNNRPSTHLFAWHKWLLGWLDPSQLHGLVRAGVLEETLTPLETPGGMKAVVVPTSDSTAYVVEVRRRIGEDAQLCDEGVLVWFVDSTKYNSNQNAVVQAARRDSNEACGAIYNAAFDLGEGEISTFENSDLRVELLEERTDGSYRIRVTRK